MLGLSFAPDVVSGWLLAIERVPTQHKTGHLPVPRVEDMTAWWWWRHIEILRCNSHPSDSDGCEIILRFKLAYGEYLVPSAGRGV